MRRRCAEERSVERQRVGGSRSEAADHRKVADHATFLWSGMATQTRLVPGDVFPGDLAVDPDVARQPEHPLAEDVAHDLGGATLDGVGAAAEERLLDRVGALDVIGPDHVVGAVEHAVGAHQVDTEGVDPLVGLGVGQLARRALRPR